MLKACSKCGKIHEYGFKCNAGSLPRTNEQTLRNLSKWHKKSEQIRERSFYLCAICKDKGDYRAKDIEVHHIRKLRDYPQGLTEDANLISLCIDHHKQADRGEIDPDYLRKLADQRDGLLDI